MSLINIENDILFLSNSPILNYIPNKYYRLYQSYTNNDFIIINGSFMFNNSNELYKSNKKTYFKNMDKLYIHTNKYNFHIDIDNIKIEDMSPDLQDIVYKSDITIKKNIKCCDIIIMLKEPIIINITFNSKSCSNKVFISSIINEGFGGSSYSYIQIKYPNLLTDLHNTSMAYI